MPEARGPEFTEIPAAEGIGPSFEAKSEAAQLELARGEITPNSVTINAGWFKIRWTSESSAPVFCLLSILALLLFGLMIAIVSACNSALTWPGDVFKFLGQAILTLVGAVVGASTVSPSRVRKQPLR